MGQYYRPVVINDYNEVVAWLRCYDFNSGSKLMEHSWLLNDFVATFENQLSEFGKYHKSRVVWAGDYADKEDGLDSNLYFMTEEVKKMELSKVDGSEMKFRYLVNHTKKEYVDKTKVKSVDDWRIHPLPLLTCEGNGRGGGDYHINTYTRKYKDTTIECNYPGEAKTIGRWARDVISAENTVPDGFSEFKFRLFENW